MLILNLWHFDTKGTSSSSSVYVWVVSTAWVVSLNVKRPHSVVSPQEVEGRRDGSHFCFSRCSDLRATPFPCNVTPSSVHEEQTYLRKTPPLKSKTTTLVPSERTKEIRVFHSFFYFFLFLLRFVLTLFCSFMDTEVDRWVVSNRVKDKNWGKI